MRLVVFGGVHAQQSPAASPRVPCRRCRRAAWHLHRAHGANRREQSAQRNAITVTALRLASAAPALCAMPAQSSVLTACLRERLGNILRARDIPLATAAWNRIRYAARRVARAGSASSTMWGTRRSRDSQQHEDAVSEAAPGQRAGRRAARLQLRVVHLLQVYAQRGAAKEALVAGGTLEMALRQTAHGTGGQRVA